jgi:dihydrofolate reductase
MSLDGRIARPDGGLDWLERFQNTGENCGYATFARSVQAILLGRQTYETALSFFGWPEGSLCTVVLPIVRCRRDATNGLMAG